MGVANSALSTSTARFPADEITTVSEGRVEGQDDPVLQRLHALKIALPLLKSPPPQSESSFSEILVKKPPSSSSLSGTLDSRVLSELFSVYRDWMEENAKRISQKQEELENKIEVADALAVKLLQRYNYSVSSMRTTVYNLSEVHPLQIEVGELKGRLTEVISNCDALCKRIATGSETFGPSGKPSSANDVEPDHSDTQNSAASPT